MSHLWVEEENGKGWGAILLAPEHRYHVTGRSGRQVLQDPSGPIEEGGVICARGGSGRQFGWVLMSSRGRQAIRVNGLPVVGGIRSLRDKDELLSFTSARVFFSAEEQARVEAFPGSDRLVKCPRCQSEIGKNQPAVLCPQCRVWSHQSEDLPCWAYPARPKCASCGHPAELGSGFVWDPSLLE